MNNIKLTIKQLLLNFSQISSNIWQLIMLLCFPIIMLVIPIIFMPLRYSFPIYIFISVIVPVGIIYISLTYNWRESTLYKNQLSSSNNKMNFYSSAFITMILFSMLLLLISILLLASLSSIMPTKWLGSVSNEGQYKYVIFSFGIVGIIYETILSVGIMFAILFFAQNIINRKQTMYIVVMSLIIITVIFGGGFNGYFNSTTEIQVEASNFGLDNPFVEITSEGVKQPKFNGTTFPEYLYWPTALFYPFFSTTQHMGTLSSQFVYQYSDQLNEWIMCPDGYLSSSYGYNHVFWTWEKETIADIVRFSSADALKWNILWFIPYIWISVLGLFGYLLSKKHK